MINRVILVVLDSAGVGELCDAECYNDKGTNTIGHILDFEGKDFCLPNLAMLGLYNILERPSPRAVVGCWGKMATKSPAKDTTAGHWEIAGIVLNKPFPTYPNGFPKNLIENFEKLIGTKVIGNKAASGTEIIKELGAEHMKTGFPIVYTSADSVFQIAAHEESFGLERLYKICEIARKMLAGENAVGRVIARPFIGHAGDFVRTVNRKDYSLDPAGVTVLDEIKSAGGAVAGIGKIEDIFNGKGLTSSVHTKGNADGIKNTIAEIAKDFSGNKLIFTNLVDFDMLWGHRRDIDSYAKALKDFDDVLPEILNLLKEDDMLIITADHGCDPACKAHTDHTREYVPLMVYGKSLQKCVNLGLRDTLADVGQTIADIFGLKKLANGTSFKGEIIK